MKTIIPCLLAIFLVLFSTCNQKSKVIPEKKQQQEVSKDPVSQKDMYHQSAILYKLDSPSKLKEKVTRLAQLTYNYQLKTLDIVIPTETTLLGRLYYITKLKESTSNLIDFETINHNVIQVQIAFLKGTKPMQPNGNTYPRVTIEEYICETSATAKATYDILIKSKKNASLWTYVSKSPNDLFVEENKIYFVNSGGYYMMEIYKEIVEKIKD